MGCGKSSVGRELSRLLCCPFMDLDEVIEQTEGRSIAEIFASDGEAAFRQMEFKALRNIVVPEARGWKQSLPSQAMGPSLCGQRGSTVSNPSPLAPSHLDNSDRSNRLADAPLSSKSIAPQSTVSYTQEMGVLALGGGTVMTPKCREIVQEHTICIYLKASADTLVQHLTGQTAGRPILSGTCHSERPEAKESLLRQRIENLMARRAETYEKTAHIIIKTDGRSIADIAQEINKSYIK